MELWATVRGVMGGAWTLAKEVGKGGGGDAEEPTVCATVLPVGLGVAYALWRSFRRTRQARPAF